MWKFLLILLYFISGVSSCAWDWLDKCPKNFAKQIKFQLYLSPSNYTWVNYETNVNQVSNFKPDVLTAFYFHGWSENPGKNIESIKTMSDALLTQRINVVILDYYSLVLGDGYFQYADSVVNAPYIGFCIGQYLRRIYPKILPVHLVRLIGHSMGAQIMACSAKTFGEGQLRLTALDPAAPLFALRPSWFLKKRDASFLDVFHTDAENYGEGGSLGHVDYFPNNGVRVQPYCKIATNNDSQSDFCSHHMSWKYFADSVLKSAYLAVKCLRKNKYCTKQDIVILTFPYCNCEKYGTDIEYMGWNVNTSVRGDYYSTTGTFQPFGLGEKGLPESIR